ncbi:NUDIX domain-containing protein [Rhizoctonia solani AG-1 IA]|uniref:NUDIX domain-containing protein n=1 Tax=Thanatephorus cucumeris (strain AG1-IA) TaxID=983506 RepID=L8WV65_THACA|nr:NUDIX domain-containing protein [Rhizoctonia solani AG-1 IA]
MPLIAIQHRITCCSGESVEETAIRELEEETGYKASGVAEVSPLLVIARLIPAISGMTSANMKLIALNVDVKEGEEPSQKLDEGEHIVKRIIELDNLMEELQGYERKGTGYYHHVPNNIVDRHGYRVFDRCKTASLCSRMAYGTEGCQRIG